MTFNNIIEKILKFINYKPQTEEQVVYLGEFTKKEITLEDKKIYFENKDVLAVELKYVHNRLLSLYQNVREAKTDNDRLNIQARIDETYKTYNRLNIIVNPELYMQKKEVKK